MDDVAKRIAEQLRAIEARHRKAGKRLERQQADHLEQEKAIADLHRMLAAVVASHGPEAGMSPGVVANITGPKVPPND